MSTSAKATVLVIDDDSAIVEMLQMALEEENYRVMTAYHGGEGLEQLAASKADLVLCDVMMPGIDGRDFCKAVADTPAYQGIPVVLMSAGRLEIDRRAYPHVAFLPKPFGFGTLLGLIERILNDHQGRSVHNAA